MMASLYQRGSSSRVKPSVISRIGCAGLLLLPQYMNRHFRRPQLHVIPRALPHESDPGEQIHHAIGMSHVDSQILSAPGSTGRFSDSLWGGPLTPEFAPRGACRSEPSHEGRTPAALQVFIDDIRGVRPEVRPEKFRNLCPGQLGEIFSEFMFRVAPREIRIGLIESELCQMIHDIGTCKSLR